MAEGPSPATEAPARAQACDAEVPAPEAGQRAQSPMATCGTLHCQKDSYARGLTTRVVSCAPSREKKEKGKVWEVCLEDTVLFPEGGGQPCDLGKVGPSNVLRVVNFQGQATHFVDAPLEPGQDVEVVLDWARRNDLMQQHSAQHLITALAIEAFGYETLSWELKPDPATTTTLDLGTEELTAEEFEQLERRVNAAIAEERAVAPRWVDPAAPEVESIRCRGLPEGVVGPLRVLEIDGIDTNLCCGTHVKSTAHLRQVKLLQTERIRDRGKTHARLHFVAGDRILSWMGAACRRQLQLNGLLAVAPDSHASSVEALLNVKKEKTKEVKTLLAEVVEFTVERLKQRVASGEKVLDVHRESGDMELMRDLASAMDSSGALLLTTFGGPGPGTFMLSGPAGAVAELGPEVAKILQGRGGGKGRYQGKAEQIGARAEALALLKEAAATKITLPEGAPQ